MWGIAGTLDDSIISGLAEYYAKQPPMHSAKGPVVLIEEGKALFQNGIPSKKIPACASCHGENAEGAAIFPRLAGQHAEYLVRQLTVIRQNLRRSPLMHGIVQQLSEKEMKALATPPRLADFCVDQYRDSCGTVGHGAAHALQIARLRRGIGRLRDARADHQPREI